MPSDTPLTLMRFSSPWCAPCKQLGRVLPPLAAAHQLPVTDVDASAQPALAAAHKVRAVPVLIAFAGGQELERMVGFSGIEPLRRFLDRVAAHRGA